MKKIAVLLAAFALPSVSKATALNALMRQAGVSELPSVPPAKGTPPPISMAPSSLTALQKHVAFFDKNGNGVVTVPETAQGLQKLGLGRVQARATASAIHLLLGPKTSGSWSSLDIKISNIHLGKHGSDTGVFDAAGDFVPEAFEKMFSRFDLNRSNSLSEQELKQMIAAHEIERPGQKFASTQEFNLLLAIAADATENVKGKPVCAISKERLGRFYDGSLFYELEKRASPPAR